MSACSAPRRGSTRGSTMRPCSTRPPAALRRWRWRRTWEARSVRSARGSFAIRGSCASHSHTCPPCARKDPSVRLSHATLPHAQVASSCASGVPPMTGYAAAPMGYAAAWRLPHCREQGAGRSQVMSEPTMAQRGTMQMQCRRARSQTVAAPSAGARTSLLVHGRNRGFVGACGVGYVAVT